MRFQLIPLLAALLLCSSEAAISKPVTVQPSQGWIDLAAGSSFSTDVSALCRKEIKIDAYGPGVHRCADNNHSIAWAYACPKGTIVDMQKARWSSVPTLDANLYATGPDGNVAVVIPQGHGYGSNELAAADRCLAGR